MKVVQAGAEMQAKFQKQALQQVRQTLVNTIKKHFPSTARFARGVIYTIDDATQLSELLIDVSTARTPKDVMDLLVTAMEKQRENENEQLPESGDE